MKLTLCLVHEQDYRVSSGFGPAGHPKRLVDIESGAMAIVMFGVVEDCVLLTGDLDSTFTLAGCGQEEVQVGW
jgi:hypothetical protein